MEATLLVYQDNGSWFVKLAFDDGIYLVSEMGYKTEQEARTAIGDWCERHNVKQMKAN